MSDWTLAPEVLEYYRRGGETNRLHSDAAGRLERDRTKDVLGRVLPRTPASIMDIGGARGVYAEWLVSRGHQVHLVDPVPDHVDAAARIPGVTAQLADARELPAADDSYDAAIVLGPLYHLQTRHERLKALTEVRRVVRPGGVAAIATINRFAAWHDNARRHRLTDEQVDEMLAGIVAGGELRSGAAGLFTTAYLHRPDEIFDECLAAGLSAPRQYGLEGAAWLLADLDADLDEPDRYSLIMSGLRRMECEPTLLGISGHLLTVVEVS